MSYERYKALRHTQKFMFDKVSTNLRGHALTEFLFSRGPGDIDNLAFLRLRDNMLSHNSMFNPSLHHKSYSLAVTEVFLESSLMDPSLSYLLLLSKRERKQL